jgi:hypothetical protein
VQKVISGINAGIFACGQTGTGKTHPMTGTKADPGITQLAAASLYNSGMKIGVSYMQIYLNTGTDLLSKASAKLKMREVVRETDSQIMADGLSTHTIGSAADVDELTSYSKGATIQRQGASRNHCRGRLQRHKLQQGCHHPWQGTSRNHCRGCNNTSNSSYTTATSRAPQT